jgi:hypothetical protein
MSDSSSEDAKHKRLEERLQRLEKQFAEQGNEIVDANTGYEEVDYEALLDRLSPQAQAAAIRLAIIGPAETVSPVAAAGRPRELDEIIQAYDRMRKEKKSRREILQKLNSEYGTQYTSEDSMAESIRQARARRRKKSAS